MIDHATVDRIFAAANIAEVVGDFVTLKKKGVNYLACCPFHNEKTPSFVVSPTKGLFKCFGCGKGGNAVTFVMEHESLSFPEALKYVARKYGIEVEERQLTAEDQQKNDDRESMMVVSAFAADYFKETLHRNSEGKSVGLSYFRERGFSEATIERFQLGFCPTAGDAFTQKALKEGYQEKYLIDTGLSIKKESGGWYDRFAGRVIFPIHSVSGRVVAFGGRTLRTDKKVAKYLNSPESEIYHKSNVLYGLYQAKRAIAQEDYCILVEGYTDVISMHQSGVENVVASSGTSLTEGQIKLIARFSKNVTVIYDGDSAGIKASLRGIDMILKEGLNVRVVLLPEGEDPDSFAREHTAAELREYISENEQDFISFKAKLLLNEASNDPIKRAALISDMVDSIAVIPEAIARSVYLKECALLMRIDEGVLQEEVRRRRRDTQLSQDEKEFFRRREQLQKEQTTPALLPTTAPEGTRMTGSGMDELERELITYLLRYGCQTVDFKRDEEVCSATVAAAILEELDADGIDMENPLYTAILKEYRAIQAENPAYTSETFPMHRLTDYPDAQVCNAVVDILMPSELRKPSKLWERNEIYLKKEDELLSEAVPRTITLYKTKIIEQMIDTLRQELAQIGESQVSAPLTTAPQEPAAADPLNDRTKEILSQMNRLNELRNRICTRYSRIIL
ncbi:MAG: DNA primase [Rikenellaceae bacterium]|jgi:DNA primase|nr:DNA primase [Rikenellaceae bacterium]